MSDLHQPAPSGAANRRRSIAEFVHAQSAGGAKRARGAARPRRKTPLALLLSAGVAATVLCAPLPAAAAAVAKPFAAPKADAAFVRVGGWHHGWHPGPFWGGGHVWHGPRPWHGSPGWRGGFYGGGPWHGGFGWHPGPHSFGWPGPVSPWAYRQPGPWVGAWGGSPGIGFYFGW